MFEEIKLFVIDYIKGLDVSVIIESKVVYGTNKLEYALSIEGYMASISILSDYTYDFFAIESENMLMVKTMNFKSTEDILNQLKEDLDGFTKLKKV